MSSPKVAGGKLVAWLGFGFGTVMSIAGNVLYTWVPRPPENAPEDWAPPTDWAPSIPSQIGAAVWSVGLLLAVEILSRVTWPEGRGWQVAKYGGAGTVAVGSAVISYGHLQHVLYAWGYGLGSYVGPLVLDGLMVVSGFALLAMGTELRPTKATAPKRPAPRVSSSTDEQRTHLPTVMVQAVKGVRVVDPPNDLSGAAGMRERARTWALESWPCTGTQIRQATGVSRSEADRARLWAKEQKEARAS